MNLMQLFELCMKAKEYGIDAFFNYSPHINAVEVMIFNNGWELKVDEQGALVRDKSGVAIGRLWDKSFHIYIDGELFKENIEAAREYLTELISIKKGER